MQALLLVEGVGAGHHQQSIAFVRDLQGMRPGWPVAGNADLHQAAGSVADQVNTIHQPSLKLEIALSTPDTESHQGSSGLGGG